MNIEFVLDVWKRACSCAGIRWYLFEETLLCAVGYQNFPDDLVYPQVMVFSEDLRNVLKYVVPELPKNWNLKIQKFCKKRHILLFYRKGIPVLQVCVLYGAENTKELDDFADKVKYLNSKVSERKDLHKVCCLIPLYKKTIGKLMVRNNRKLESDNFRKFVSVMGNSCSNANFYRDGIDDKDAITLPSKWFDSSLMLICGNIEYPVFSGYKEYLTDLYGDYENGLFDGVGCGLTVEEKHELKNHQDRCMDVLTFLQELSAEFGIHYYLLAGSVLGCVRHRGFIPWDDDIDIGIKIEELEMFEKVVKEQLPIRLPSGFELMQASANDPYPRMFSKICFNGRCCVDLWPLIPTFNDGIRAKFIWRFAKAITKVHYVKIGHSFVRFYKIAEMIGKFLTDKLVMSLARRNERIYSGKQTPAYINLYSIYSRQKETIQRTWIETETTAVFDGLEVPVIGCTEEYLRHLYGDYMRMPAPWKRASRHTARFFKVEQTVE